MVKVITGGQEDASIQASLNSDEKKEVQHERTACKGKEELATGDWNSQHRFIYRLCLALSPPGLLS